MPPVAPLPRVVLHVDLDAFFCSVEELLDPSLAGVAFAVGGPADARGVIATASYAARRFGVRSALPTAQALRLCPHLKLLPVRHKVYSGYSRRVMALFAAETPLMEQVSIDEAFLDFTGDARGGGAIAARLQARLRDEIQLPSSFGVATNKLVAKIATNLGKPRGLIVVPPGQEAACLAPLPLDLLWGAGPKTRARLAEIGLRTIGDLAAWPAADLERRFGAAGLDLARHARGLDDRPVENERETKSISKEVTFGQDVSDRETLRRTLLELSDQVAAGLRAQGLVARTVKLKLRWPPFETITRQTQLAQPSDLEDDLFAAGFALFEAAFGRGRPVRLLGMGVTGLQTPARQLGLFEAASEAAAEDARAAKLAGVLDKIRSKYGWDALRRAAYLGEDDAAE
ncbi:MAG: DNA polymerase IV [Anaerolineales bacterium]|nr:DNA polymerase IV [Anaerolineales bacterium]